MKLLEKLYVASVVVRLRLILAVYDIIEPLDRGTR